MYMWLSVYLHIAVIGIPVAHNSFERWFYTIYTLQENANYVLVKNKRNAIRSNEITIKTFFICAHKTCHVP